MKITNIRIRKVAGEGKMRAIASVTFDDQLALHDIKIIEAAGKRFVAMPSRKASDGQFQNIVHPISSEFRDLLESEILKQFDSLND